ncbi:MAG: DUF2264 domain-containing protein [Methanobacteriaceae archaeon]|jgi:hypothetical protein|nr:DUF2264 domain-containing protein [Methanobacteriaceae archaeon]
MIDSIFRRLRKKPSKNEDNVYSPMDDRVLWVKLLQKIAWPVLINLKSNNLKKNMPYESINPERKKFSYLEAFARLFCGISSWLELGIDETEEGVMRGNYIDMTIKCLNNIVNPNNTDYINFKEPKQSLVDAAFLAQGLLRSKNQIWFKLSIDTQSRIIKEFKKTRDIAPYKNNWLLFTSIIEATLLEFTGECDQNRLTYGINKFKDEWYLGDGIYSDGENFRLDYYNSLVIHPMLIDVLHIMKKYGIDDNGFLDLEIKRSSRYAAELERLISPEGTYPVIGRSMAYRTGIFHTLAQSSLIKTLPDFIKPAQVRSAFTEVLKKQFAGNQNFDDDGWLCIGLNGSQIDISESYINTGSLYLCSTIFLPLGLSYNDPFWSEPFTEWTNLKAWDGNKVVADRFIDF